MATDVVTKARKNCVTNRTHRHIGGVCTVAGVHYSRQEVVSNIHAGNTAGTSADGYTARITTIKYCPRAGCLATPYIKTNPDRSRLDNLENLPEC